MEMTIREEHQKVVAVVKDKLAVASVTKVRQYIQKMRMAAPENFEELQRGLDEALNAEIGNMGSQEQSVREEAEKAVEMATKRKEQLEEQKRKAEEKRLEQEPI